MKVLVVGGGGREHALVWKLSQSPRVTEIYCAPGNAGTQPRNVNISATDLDGLLAFALEKKIDFTVVGMDASLALGIVDLFKENGLRIFGPSKAAAAIESSKVFAKDLMRKYGIPTARYGAFDDYNDATRYLDGVEFPIVIKADGLALGKGVVICANRQQALDALDVIMVRGEFGDSGKQVVIEEFLRGREISVFAFCDGKDVLPFASARDYKRALDGDQGLNTGGMGSISPCPYYTDELHKYCMERIFLPTVSAMKAEGRPYTGVLYFGLMDTSDGVKVLEYNARFGDPETQAVLPRMESDLLDALEACVDGTLGGVSVKMSQESAVCVIMASSGYPGKYETGKVIRGLGKDATVFHAGTKTHGGEVRTNGGRVLGVVGMGGDVDQAARAAYTAVGGITFDDAHFRKDIGKV